MSITLVRNNLAVLRNKISQTSIESEMGRLEIAIDMLSKEAISRTELNQIIRSRSRANIIKLSLVKDLKNIIDSKAIPEILAAANPTSTSGQVGAYSEVLSELPHFTAGSAFSVVSTSLTIKTMWDIQSISDNFAKSPQQFNRLFVDWRSWRVEVDYGR
jgi:hypothetical protein